MLMLCLSSEVAALFILFLHWSFFFLFLLLFRFQITLCVRVCVRVCQQILRKVIDRVSVYFRNKEMPVEQKKIVLIKSNCECVY